MKVASRFLLPVEMLAGLYTLLWGLSGMGAFGDCTLYYALLAMDHNLEWGIGLGVLGGAMALVAWVEWTFGRVRVCIPPERAARWPSGPFWWISMIEALRAAWWTVRCYRIGWEDQLRRRLAEPSSIYWFVGARATIAFLMCGVWIGAVAVVFTSPTLLTIATLYPAALLHVGASFWIYHANLKVKYALDPRIPTSTLQFHR